MEKKLQASNGTEKRMSLRWTIAIYSVIWPAFLLLSLIYIKLALDRIGGLEEVSKTTFRKDERLSSSIDTPQDKLLGGLLSSNYSKSSCLSRRQLTHYLKPSHHMPSSYLITKLRSYEAMHKRCGPFTKSYDETIAQFGSGSRSSTSPPCKYLVHMWMKESGLGNRFLSLISSFLYSILTDRVLLIDQGPDMDGLFCEPFPNSTWVLPSDFPLRDEFTRFHASYSDCFGNMAKNMGINFKFGAPSYMYINLIYDYNDDDKRFFCEFYQNPLERVPWLFVKSDQYYLPSLFSIPSFEKELRKLFPKTDTVFHHLGRYLFLPSDRVWGFVTRFYDAYLAKADERIGIQIRDYGATYLPFEGMKDYIFKYYIPHLAKYKPSVYEETDVTSPLLYMMDKMLECSFINNLLPRATNTNESTSTKFQKRKSKAVLVTSLNSMYYENLTELYSENPTINGDVVGVFQPSHEGFQQNNDVSHNMKALAEMYLLSMMDELITSPWSTFGYVAQGLGGLNPWVINNPQKDPSFGGLPCFRTLSMEPCFHFPPIHDCKVREGVENTHTKSYVRSCEDTVWGLKLFYDNERL